MTTSPEPKLDKTAIVTALAEEWAQIAKFCAALDAAQWELDTECPGWTVQDNVSHIIGTELSMAGEPAPDIDSDDAPYVKNPIGSSNEKWVQARRTRTGAAILEEFNAVRSSRIASLEAMSQADFDAPSWTPAGEATLGRMLRIRLFDSWMHDQDIRQATGRPGNESGGHVDLAIQEIIDSMGYVVGKLGRAPEGARVEIRLTGPSARTVRVAVNGRASLVTEFDGEPTIGIEMPTLLFTRLCGGRQTATRALERDEIQLFGDEAAARYIVEHLAYMI
jgi:uncharacterized protein (TIGR03083 family)